MDAPRFTSQHRFTKADIQDHLEAVVEAANATGGPIVRKVPGKGYGLFADREYAPDDKVTRYGGRWGGAKLEGPYVIAFANGRRLDGAYGFFPSEKGRWINDPQTRASQTEEELHRLDNVNALLKGTVVWMVATRFIAPGEEILWYYGDEYDRDWLLPEETETEESLDTSSSSSSTLAQPPPPPEAPVQQQRPLTMLEQLRKEGADDAYIERLQKWLAPHGYRLATFDMRGAQRDPGLFEQMPRDLRYLLMRTIMSTILARTAGDPCVGVARILWLGARIRSMKELLERDDELWHRFFQLDFEPFQEKAHWWTRERPFPWRCAYLWTVFLRRRCLRELANLRGNSLAKGREQTFRPIPFGRSGCVTALEVYERAWDDPETSRRFTGYATARDLAAGGQFVYGSASLHHTAESVQAQHSSASPALELLGAMVLRSPVNTFDGMRLRWSVELSPLHTGSLSSAVTWDYGGLLFAYCWLNSHTLSAEGEAFFREIFNALPQYPRLGNRLYLGDKAATDETE